MYWLRRLFRKHETEKQLDAELRFHLERQVADYVKSGMSPDEAYRRARIEFGGLEGLKEECRESRRVHALETLLQDVRYGLRMMRRSPGFTAVAIATLTLGIGANTAIFSVVNGVLLRPLEYPHPEQLITLHESRANFPTGSVSYPNFRDWQKENQTFSAMAITRTSSFSLTKAGEAEQVSGMFMSADLFPLLGVSPVLGRNLFQGEDEIGAPPQVLIGAGLWQRKFGGASDILSKTITLDGKDYAIIGVIPASFRINIYSLRASDVYAPIGQWSNPLLPKRAAPLGMHVIGRLKPGVSLEQAGADMTHVGRSLELAYPDINKGIGVSLIPLRERIVGDVQPFLLLLLAAAGFVLLIACVNVANLLLARSTGRTREFGIRIALGASTRRVVCQLLTESVLLGLAGGGLGLALAAWGVPAMLKIMPVTLPRAEDVGLDGRVLFFTIVASLLSGLIFGLIPAWKTSRPDVLVRMRQSGLNASRKSHRTQNIFVVAEIGLAVVLLTGTGLMIRSLARLWTIDAGFDPHNLLTFNVSLPPSMSHASPDAIRATYRQLDERLASIPGIEASSVFWGSFPLGSDDEQLFWMEGQPKPSNDNDMDWALRYTVGPGYLAAMGTPLLRGRFFSLHDDEHAPLVVAVDEIFAEKFFPNQDPLGKRIHLLNGYDGKLAQIVGVVRHVRQWGLDSDEKQIVRAQVYLPAMQLPDAFIVSANGDGIVVRSKVSDPGLFNSIRNNLQQMNAEQVIHGAETMDEMISRSLAARRYSMILLSAFAALALLLASVGIYGVISYVVGQRTQEIGVRMALGARAPHVIGMFLAEGSKLVVIGVLGGLAAALALTRLMTIILFRVSPTDPITFASVALLLISVAVLACAVPVRRAIRVDPIIALRYE